MMMQLTNRLLRTTTVLSLVVPIASFHGMAFSRSLKCSGKTSFNLGKPRFLSASQDQDIVPTIEQLESDGFMKQVGYSKGIVDLLQQSENQQDGPEMLSKRLRAQLSHADGIRGFMVTYLTSKGENESLETPAVLVDSILHEIDVKNDSNELVALMCMNVIMPTAMVTMHENEELSKQSAWTASRATALMKNVLDKADDDIREVVAKECESILTVTQEATPEGDDAALRYWREFFEKWGYKETQREDIASAVRSVLS